MSEKNNNPESESISSDPVLYKVKMGIAYITLNTKMNTINMDTARKIVQLLTEADKNPKVKVVVLNSIGDKVFSAGFDLAMFQQGFSDKIMDDLLLYGRDISRAIYFLKKPVISQIQGSAIGMGCIMALASDFRFVANKEGLFFRLPEIDIQIFPATGPTAMAVNILGVSHAKDMLITGRKVFLDEFDRWGAITKICEPENLASEVKKFARE
ncbi:MAG: enoyl-CoA hydratase/isomerase family protein, partial [Promethearchaeota archaeon]